MEWQRLRPPNTEVGLASGLLALGLFESLTNGAAHRAQLVVAVVLQTVPLAWRRTSPATAAVLAFIGVLVELSTGSTKADAAGFLSFMILCFSVPRYARPIGMLVGGSCSRRGRPFTNSDRVMSPRRLPPSRSLSTRRSQVLRGQSVYSSGGGPPRPRGRNRPITA